MIEPSTSRGGGRELAQRTVLDLERLAQGDRHAVTVCNELALGSAVCLKQVAERADTAYMSPPRGAV